MIKLSHVEVPYEAAERVRALMLAGIIGQSQEVIEEFEEKFARWVGSKYAVAVSSGTMADTIALAVLKHFYPNRTEVIVPALTFIAQINAVTYNGLKPVFVDVDQYFNMDMPNALDKADMNTLCLFPADLLGRPAIFDIGGNYKDLPIIEDACEAMGSLAYLGEKCGTRGRMGTFSFFPSHTITCGEGGMIVTDNKEYADLARRLRNHGKINNDSFHFDVIGFNGKITSIQAVIGIEMLKTADRVIERRRDAYFALGGTEGAHEHISPHAFPVICESEAARDAMLKRLRENDIECRNLFSCIPTQEKAYASLGYRLGDFPVAEDIGRRGLYVPCHAGLKPQDIQKIKEVVSEKEASREVLTA